MKINLPALVDRNVGYREILIETFDANGKFVAEEFRTEDLTERELAMVTVFDTDLRAKRRAVALGRLTLASALAVSVLPVAVSAVFAYALVRHGAESFWAWAKECAEDMRDEIVEIHNAITTGLAKHVRELVHAPT